MERYANKRMLLRNTRGQFRKVVAADLGIGGWCKTCGHALIHHYDGDPRDEFPNPKQFRYRCFTCEPSTPTELDLERVIEGSRPSKPSIIDLLQRAVEQAT